MGSSNISISKKHLKLIEKPKSFAKNPDPLQKGMGKQQLVGEEWSRGTILHTYQQRTSTHAALTGKGHRRGDLALAPGSFAAESGNCSFLCALYRCHPMPLPSVYPKTTQQPSATCLTPVCSNLPPVSTTYNTVFYGWSASLQRCNTWCYLLEEKSLSIFYSEYFLHWFFQIIHSVN